MNKVLSFWKKYGIYILAFLVPWIIAVITAVTGKGWITGSGSILNGDTSTQLVPFAYELWDKVHNGTGFDYTWNTAGGIDFTAISGYYISPFTLLILLAPRTSIVIMVQVVMILKWACAAVTMVYFFNNTKYNTLIKHKEAVSFFLGIAFVLSSSQINFVRYIQFTDVTICFPLLLLLVEKMVMNEKWILYCIILTFCMLSNSYMTFGVCIFLVMWFIFQMGREIDNKLKKFLIFSGSSILSALISTASIVKGLSIASDRLENTVISERTLYAKRILISVSDFIRQLFIFSPIHVPTKPDPNIYFSIMGVILIGFFPVINISRKRKWFMLGWLFFLIVSFFSGALSLVWHLFVPPNGVLHRFSNLFIFTALFISLYVIIHLKDISRKHVVTVGIISIIAYCYTFFTIEIFDSLYVYLFTAILLVLYIMLMFLFCKGSISYNNMVLVIVIFGLCELLANAVVEFNIQYDSTQYATGDNITIESSNLAEKAVMGDGERLSAPAGVRNVGLLVSKPSIAGFASSINGNMHSLMSSLGMGVNGKVAYTTKGASPLINLMFDVRDIIAANDTEISDAVVVSENKFYKLYETQRLAGIGYMVNPDIASWNPYVENSFDNQNSFVKLATGMDDKIFTIIDPDVKCTDIAGDELIRDKDFAEDNAYVYNYTSVYGDENDSIQIEFVADEDMDLYVDARSSYSGKFAVFIDEEMLGTDDAGYFRSTYHIGNVKKGQKITMVAIVNSDYYIGADTYVYFRFAKFDETVYQEIYERLSSETYIIDTYESDYIKGTINAQEDGIMMTSIQAEAGYDVYIDGYISDYFIVGGALIGVPLGKGEHIIEFKYSGFDTRYGKIVSLIGIITLIALSVWTGLRDNNKMINKTVEE